MNNVQEPQVKPVSGSTLTREERLLRLKAAERRRKRKKRRQTQIILAVCIVVVMACSFAIAFIMKDNASETVDYESYEDTTYESEPSATTPYETEDPEVEKKPKKNAFSGIAYYKEEFLERYEAYAKKNPDLKAGDVVWMVNAYQDKPKYEYDVPVSGYDTSIIVNKYYKVPDNYKPSDLVDYGGAKLHLRRETGEAYMKMKEDAKKLGYHIQLVSGYRSVEYQRNLYNGYLNSDPREVVDTYSARPGYSEHHTGMAMDIFGSNCNELRDFVNSPEYPWVRDNCYKYGFIIRYTEENEDITGYDSEPWHLRYIGVEASTDMKNKGINSYEEYYAKYVDVD